MRAPRPKSPGWLGVYWSTIRQEGFGPGAATFPGQSYRFAPHEAWIQLIRAPLALRGFGALPCALKDYAAQDFEDILRVQAQQCSIKRRPQTPATATRPNLRFAASRTADLPPFCHRERIADPPPMLSVRRQTGLYAGLGRAVGWWVQEWPRFLERPSSKVSRRAARVGLFLSLTRR
jgi:hypothetical protein